MYKEKGDDHMKVRKTGVSVKILICVLVLLLLSDIAIGGLIYKRANGNLVDQIRENSVNLVGCVAGAVDGNDLNAVVSEEDVGSEAYNNVLDALAIFRDNSNAEYVYTVRKKADGSCEFVVDSDPEEPGLPGEDFEGDEEEIAAAYSGKTVVTKESYVDEWGEHLSAYSPIYADGKVVGLGVVDVSMTWINEQSKSLLLMIVSVCTLILVIGAVVMVFLGIVLRRGFSTLNTKISELSDGNGDLTRSIDLSGGDEFETIGSNVNKFMDYIRNILITIDEDTNEMNNAIDTMTRNVDDTMDNADHVSSTMEEMSSTMQEISASLHNIDSLVQASAEAFENIIEKINEGNEYTAKIHEEAVETGNKAARVESDVTEKVADMAAIVKEKIEDSRAVEKINLLTEDIINITEQTNLLSLNASIEAARAGEMGRGFAVVAAEIGKLAQDSANAAAEIQQVSSNLISAVDGLANEAQQMVDFMNETAVGGYKQLVETSDDFKIAAEKINTMMNDFRRLSSEIDDNMKDVSGLTGKLNTAVDDAASGIARTTDKTVEISDSMKAISREAHGGKALSDDIYKNVNNFKLKE